MTYGFELVCAALEREGVRHVFGVPGTQSVHLYEGLRRSRMRTVLNSSELAAAFAAGAYGRVTGRPGVLVTIPGPGFTYALSGLAEARLDSAPLVHLTWQPPSTGRPFELQAIDQRAIAAPLVKRVIDVDEPLGVADAVADAFESAGSDEPGPVLVQFAARALTDEVVRHGEAPQRHPAERPGPDPQAVAAALQRLSDAQRPILLVGQGAARAGGEVRALAEQMRAPVLTTPSGRGIVPEDHELAIGFDAPAGDVGGVNALLAAADLVLVLGAKLGHNGSVGYALEIPGARAVRVDASRAVLDADPSVAVAVCGEVGAFLGRAAPVAARSRWTMDEITGWRRRIGAGRAEDVPEPSLTGFGTPEAFFAALRAAVPRDGMLVTDSGLHQVLARRHYRVLAPFGLLFPSDFQSMGFGLPAAVAAKLAEPERAIVALVGDGSLGMTGFELATAARERLAIPVVVFHDGRLNLIRMQQFGSWGRAHAVDLPDVDLEALAAAVGAGHRRVSDGDLPEAVSKALGGGGPTLLEVEVGDSARVRTVRAGRLARESLRSVLPRWLITRLRGRN